MDKADLIKNTYLFRGIAADDLSALSRITEQAVLSPGQLVYDIDQVFDTIVIIEMGTVDIVIKGKQAQVYTMRNMQTLRELAFFHLSMRFATSIARKRTQLARIPFD